MDVVGSTQGKGGCCNRLHGAADTGLLGPHLPCSLGFCIHPSIFFFLCFLSRNEAPILMRPCFLRFTKMQLICKKSSWVTWLIASSWLGRNLNPQKPLFDLLLDVLFVVCLFVFKLRGLPPINLFKFLSYFLQNSLCTKPGDAQNCLMQSAVSTGPQSTPGPYQRCLQALIFSLMLARDKPRCKYPQQLSCLRLQG